ncbi:MAG: hypothetical protein V9G11_05275 [Bifidobacterium adolescentis]
MVDNQVENYLDPEQLDRLVEVLRTDENRMVCLILMFLISTGARLERSLNGDLEERERGGWCLEG